MNTQKEMILEILNLDGCITTYDAFIDIGCTRLPSRINELRNEGHNIGHLVCTKKNRFGKSISFFIYYLVNYQDVSKLLRGVDCAEMKKRKLEKG